MNNDDIKTKTFCQDVIETLEPVYHRNATAEEKLEAYGDAINRAVAMLETKIDEIDEGFKKFELNNK